MHSIWLSTCSAASHIKSHQIRIVYMQAYIVCIQNMLVYFFTAVWFFCKNSPNI